MAFDKQRILNEGGTYHGLDNPLIECAGFTATKVEFAPLAATGSAPAYIKEDASLPKRMVIEGVFQREGVRNANQRLYPAGMFRKALSEGGAIRRRINDRAMIGHLEHPTEGTTDLNKGAILITEAWVQDDGTVMGRAIVYNTPEGLRLQEYIATGTKVGISSRGTGTVDSKGIVQEDFQLETWDMVYNPSTPGAHPTLKTESNENGTPFHSGVVESSTVSDTLPRQQEKSTMSLSARIAETQTAASRLLATDPAKLPLTERKKLVAELLDLRVKVAEEFTGEKRVSEVAAVLEALDKAKKTCEGLSDNVGGFTASPVGDAAPVQGGDQTGVPGGAWDTISKSIESLGAGERAKALEGVNTAAKIIASHIGKLPHVISALEAAVADKKEEVKESELPEEIQTLLTESSNEIISLSEREEAASAIVLEMRNRIKALQVQLKEAEAKVVDESTARANAEKAVAELTSVNHAGQVKEAIEAQVAKHPELDAFRDVLEKAESVAGVEAKATALLKGIQEKAAQRVAEAAAQKKAPTLAERLEAAAKKRVDEALPSGKTASREDANEALRQEPAPITESKPATKQRSLLGGMAKALKNI